MELEAMMDFMEVYRAYPRHKEPRTALRAIEKAHKRLTSGNEVVAGLLRGGDCAYDFLLQRALQFAASPAGRKGEFTPYPATWFNASSYLEDPREWGCTPPRRGEPVSSIPDDEAERLRASFEAQRIKRETGFNLRKLSQRTVIP